MKRSFVNIEKMGATTVTVIINILLILDGVSSTCVHVPNNDMIEYSCVAGSPSDLWSIPVSAEKIRISNMSMPRITSDTFSRFGENLWVLTCSHCGIREIEPNAFRSLVNLQQLRLDNNLLRSVDAAWFDGLIYLTYLDFNYNEITRIDDGVYKNLPSLVDFRISGNRLQCLNIDEMSKLTDLKRIFISKNPEFKCPNAVTKFLEDRSVSFEPDPEWRRIEHDLVPASVHGPSMDWRTHPADRTSTASYHEKLISPTTVLPPYDYDDEYEKPSTELDNSAEPGRYYPERGWSPASSPVPYPSRDWPTSVPAVEATNREWPTSMPNSHPSRSWPTAQPPSTAHPNRGWPTPPAPSDYSGRERNPWPAEPEVPRRGEYERPYSSHDDIYGQRNYPPETMITSTVDSMNNRRTDEASSPAHVGHGVVPSTSWPAGNPEPPRVEWAGSPAEVFDESGYSPYDDRESGPPSRQTNPPSMSGYPANVQRYPTDTGSTAPPEDFYRPSQHSDDSSHPRILDKYQQVQEPTSVTIEQTKKDADKQEVTKASSPAQDPTSSSVSLGASILVLAIGIVLTIQ